FGGLARQRGEIGLGQRRHEAHRLAGVERPENIETKEPAHSRDRAQALWRTDRGSSDLSAAGEGRRNLRDTLTHGDGALRTPGLVGGQRPASADAKPESARCVDSREVRTERADKRAADLGEANAQVNL